VRAFLAAVRFLTVLPLPAGGPDAARDLGRSARFFPAIGILAGLAMAGLDALLGTLVSPWPGSVLVVLAMAGISGGLHLDGLADTADGFLSSRPRERVLEIMRDSRIGSMGVLAIVGVLLLKTAALATVPAGRRWATLLLMPLAGRTALVLELNLLPYARPAGLGTTFQTYKTPWDALVAIGLLAGIGYATVGQRGLLAAAGTVLVTVLVSVWCRRRIGGFTGDTLGAACEISEAVPALIAGVP
jgi:adenosylcobinamide-GDP ribazoletransferase